MTIPDQDARHFCELGLQEMWRGDADAALELYARAATIALDDETQELITIRKAEALIALDRQGPEIAALPGIVMRHRSARHVYLAANTLQRHLCETDQRPRAIFYGGIARRAADELGDPLARVSVLNHLGITLVADSQFGAALEALGEAMTALSQLDHSREEIRALRASIDVCRGGALVLRGDTVEGVRVLDAVLPLLDDDYTIAETCLDLCYGYMQLHDNDLAESYGRRGLELASMQRQVRNANHLLGEICLRTARYTEADAHFEVVAGFYPEFRNVKQLLMAVDLCAVVNWKA